MCIRDRRCTAVKRILVQEGIAEKFTHRLVEKTKEYKCGDPMDEATRVGTVIDEQAAIYIETAVKQLKCGTVNINEVPGYRSESSPFGGIKDSGLGIKEGVIEAIKCFSFVKTFSLPW